MFPDVRMLVLGTRDPWNPIPGMLDICDEVFCTEDSVSMISEAATGGQVVQILRVGKRRGSGKSFKTLRQKWSRMGFFLLAGYGGSKV